MRRFEFDPRKGRLNEERHGIRLEWAAVLWDVTHVVLTAKEVRGERRSLILAKVADAHYAVVFTERGDAIRLISCHRADRRLERIYANRIQAKEAH